MATTCLSLRCYYTFQELPKAFILYLKYLMGILFEIHIIFSLEKQLMLFNNKQMKTSNSQSTILKRISSQELSKWPIKCFNKQRQFTAYKYHTTRSIFVQSSEAFHFQHFFSCSVLFFQLTFKFLTHVELLLGASFAPFSTHFPENTCIVRDAQKTMQRFVLIC